VWGIWFIRQIPPCRYRAYFRFGSAARGSAQGMVAILHRFFSPLKEWRLPDMTTVGARIPQQMQVRVSRPRDKRRWRGRLWACRFADWTSSDCGWDAWVCSSRNVLLGGAAPGRPGGGHRGLGDCFLFLIGWCGLMLRETFVTINSPRHGVPLPLRSGRRMPARRLPMAVCAGTGRIVHRLCAQL
jgi:hypothetical protein